MRAILVPLRPRSTIVRLLLYSSAGADGMAKARRVFVETTPLAYRVVLTRDRWREIVRFKHPALAGHEADVRDCVRDPEVIRASAKDPNVHLYYRPFQSGFVCTVVGGEHLGDHV